MKPEIMVVICDIHGDATRDDNTLNLPATDEEIAAALEKAGIPSVDRCEVVGWNCNMQFLNEQLEDELSYAPDREKTLNELNFLAGHLARMSDYERALFEGMVNCCDIRDLKTLINTTYDLQNPYLMPGICSVQELGNDYLKDVGNIIPAELAGYVSAEIAGQRILKESQGAFTDAGYVVDSMLDSDPVYEGKELPSENEYYYTCYFRLKLANAAEYERLGGDAPTVVLKLPEPGYSEEAEKLACLRLGVDSLDDCAVMESECFAPLLAGIMDGARLSEAYAFTAELYEAECCGVGYYRFFAALESYGIEKPDLQTAKDALARSYDFGHYIDIHSPEDYGRQCLKENFSPEDSKLAAKVIDLKAYGEDMMHQNNAVLTSHGMVVRPEDFGRPEQGESPQMGGMTL